MQLFSHSRISSYESCPLQYRLRYVDQVDVERRETVESFMGRRVHESLQHLHERLAEGVLLSRQELLTHLWNTWEREWHAQVQIVRADKTQDDYRKMAERCLVNYYRSNHPFDRGETVGNEVEVVFILDVERDFRIRGYIDRLDRTAPGVYEIHDYKTSRRLPVQAAVNRDRQLGLYHMAVNQMMADARRVTLIWHYLAHNRRLTSERTPDDLTRLRDETIAAIERIQEATERADFPAVRSRLCDWCDYRPVCPAWNPVQESLALGPASRGSLDAPRGGR